MPVDQEFICNDIWHEIIILQRHIFKCSLVIQFDIMIYLSYFLR